MSVTSRFVRALSCLSEPLTVCVLASLIGAPKSFGSQVFPRESLNPSIRVEGLSPNEQVRLMGFLRTAAYGPNVPGALKISNQLISALSTQGPSTQIQSKEKANSRARSPKENDDGCFFTVPERFRLFKRLPNEDLCRDQGNSLVADTVSQVLFLCKDGRTVKDYDLALGWNGTGKRKEGDERTPLGIYSLSSPRRSNEGFHKFIGIGYPTPLQKKNGYTGSAVGVHGPSRWARCLGFLNAAFDWTNGCLAVTSDSQIDEIAAFVTENQVKRIAILPLEETGEK